MNEAAGPTARRQGGGGTYVVRLRGQLDESWSEWLGGLELAWDEQGNTVLCGYVADQAALHGILSKIRDLGALLLGVDLLD